MNDKELTQTGEQVDLDIHLSVTPGDDLIKKQVEIINKLSQEGGEKNEEIGEYVLIHNFNNDHKAASSRNPKKVQSYRKLIEHPDLDVSASTLNRYVRVAIQSRFLKQKGETPGDLSYSQKFMLLGLRNDAAKVELAKKIVAESLSRPQVKALINEKRQKPKPKPEAKPVSKIDLIVGSFQALTELDINPIFGEIATNSAALGMLRWEAERLADWVDGLIRKLGNCITSDTVSSD